MTPSFDPHDEWLGIPPGRRPPTHYELLGLQPGESDGNRIEGAFYERYARVRRYQLGQHAADALTVLAELARAYQVLSEVDARREYDRTLGVPTVRTGLDAATESAWQAALDGSADVTSEDAIRAARQLAWDQGGEAGLLEFARRALRACLPVDDLLAMLVKKAQSRRQHLCGACYEFVDSPGRETTARVAVTSRQDVISETLTISVATGWLRYHADLQATASEWSGPRHASSFHRGGVGIIVFVVVWVVLLLALLVARAFGSPELWWLGISPVVALAAAFSAGWVYRPRFSNGVDVAWTIVVPQWADAPITPEQVAFVGGLAHFSTGRGDRHLRSKPLDRICRTSENWARENLVSSLQLSKIFRLVLLDRLREPSLAPSAARTFSQLLDGCMAGIWPLETLYLVLRDGDWLTFALPGAAVAMRLHAYQSSARAGLVPADVLRLMSRSPGLTRLLQTPTWNEGNSNSGRPATMLEVGRYFSLLRGGFRRSAGPDTVSALELALTNRFDELARRPDLLLQSADGGVVVAHQGIFLQGRKIDDPEQVTWRTRDGGFEIVAGKLVLPWPSSPVPVLRLLQRLGQWRALHLEPEAERLSKLPPSGNLPADITRMAGTCPACQRRLFFETGKTMAEPLGGARSE